MAGDINYYSLSGAPDGSLFLKIDGQDSVQLREGLWPVYEAGEINLDLPALGIDAGKYTDVFKCSHVQNLHIGKLTVITGGRQRENAVDMNFECTNITIDSAYLEEGRQNALTIKGGCNNITIVDLAILKGAGHCDIELGNFSDQSRQKTVGIRLDRVARIGSGYVRIRVGWADDPMVMSGNLQYDRLMGFIILCYVWLKGGTS